MTGPATRHCVPRALHGSRRVALGLLLLFVSTMAASCRTAAPREVRPGWKERGIASWYGVPFHGRQTASGEIYDMYAMTAAHPTLPFGTVLEVRNLDSGKRTRVTVTDRGPFVGRRIVDLSYAAAMALDMEHAGLARVELRVLVAGDGARRPALALAGTSASSGALSYVVQVAAFQERHRADEMARRLERRYPEVRVEESPPWYRVRVGSFSDRRRAERMRQRLEAEGLAAMVMTEP